MTHRWALLLFVAPLLGGCGVKKAVKNALDPKASVLGVSIVEVTSEHVTVRVDVKTEDVDLMLGMVKVKYKLSLIDTSQEQSNGEVQPAQLLNLSDSGFSFLVKIPVAKAGAKDQKYDYLVQGAVVFRVIAKIADVQFSHRGALTF